MLTVSGLSFRYPAAQQAALDGVSLQLGRGRITGLLGPNGAGKTTLIAHLAGLLPLQQGDIRLAGEPLAGARARNPVRITLAPQEYAFYPMLTVAENLACFASVCRLEGTRKAARIAACMAFTQLEAFASRQASQLSGGLKRRLNLAIALLPEPELLLLDEPTVGVDPQSRAFLLDSVRALAAAGTTVLYTSHYIEEIETIADDVVIIDHGRVLRSAPLGELLAEEGRQLHLRADGDDAALRAVLAPFGQVEAEAEGGYSLRLAPGSSPAGVLAALEAAALPLQSVRYGSHGLEQLFMQLTRRSLRDN
ncbi:ABC transporter ATP-binding protein [Uliginosibacterium paludis]|uniref:ABC transporter ATP-binding protein n=1 Tax=Uliginosibacterium paludis TaxID=1615952 RepID=A0ABV2CLZ3_9RHOO